MHSMRKISWYNQRGGTVMEFRKLQYLLTVAETRNITRAAESLYISQSALSHYIKNVEDELGVLLFDRSTNPISLTYAGEKFMESAQNILYENEKLNKEIRDITQHMSGKLVIGTSRDRASYMMPRLLPEFIDKYPGIDLEVYTDSGENLLKSLHDGRCDLVLLPAIWNSEAKLQGIVSEKIYTEELVLAVKKGLIPKETVQKGKTLPASVLNEMSFFAMFPGHAMREYFDSYFRKQRIRPNIIMMFSSNITCYRMASTGMASAIVPYLTTRMANTDVDIDLFSLTDPPSVWDIHMFYRKDAYVGLPEKDLLSIARQVFSNEML